MPTIAVVDDDESFLDLLCIVLRQADFEVLEFADGESGLDGFVAQSPDLLLLDVSLPGRSGYEVCRAIRHNLEDALTPIIIMTGDDGMASIDEAFSSGATDFTPKPINFPLLIQRIRYTLRSADVWRQQASYQSQMQQSEKMASLGQLAAGVAHEINNPIGYVLSNVQMLTEYAQRLRPYVFELETVLGRANVLEKQRRHLARLRQRAKPDVLADDFPEMLADVEEGVNRISGIVKSLRVYAHPEEDKFRPTNLTEIIQSVSKMMMGDLKHRADTEIDVPEVPVWIDGNASKLYQVLMNLLVNSVQAIDHSHGSINIVLCQENDQAIISIKDNGHGIPEDIVSRIFDPFFTTKDIGIGTGLGLSVTMAIVEKHSGTINVVSKVGRGTVVTLRFPELSKARLSADRLACE